MTDPTFEQWFAQVQQRVETKPTALACENSETFLRYVQEASDNDQDIVISRQLFQLVLSWPEVIRLMEPSLKMTTVVQGIIGKVGSVTVYTDAYIPVDQRKIDWKGPGPKLALVP